MAINGNPGNYRKLSLGKNQGEIDLEKFKGGIKREQITDAKQLVIFDKFAGKDGILVDTEIAAFIAEIATAAKNEKFTKGEVKKLYKEGQTLEGMKEEISADDLFAFLETIETISEKSNIEKAEVNKEGKVVLTSQGGNQIETISQDNSYAITTIGEDNTLTNEFYDAEKTLLSKEVIDGDGNTTEITYEKNEAGEAVQREIKTSNGDQTKTSVTLCDESGNPTSKTTVEGLTESKYQIVEGSEVLREKTENKGLVTETVSTYDYYEGGVVQERKLDRAGNETITVIKDGNVTATKETKDGVVTTTSYNENGSTVIVEDPANNTKTKTTYNVDGYGIEQLKQVGEKTYYVQYDGKGNTLAIVQNGESPALIAKRFGVTVKQLTDANPGKLHGSYFYVGDEIKIPREVQADEKCLQGRKTREQAIGEYNRFIEQQRIQREQALRAGIVTEAGRKNFYENTAKVTLGDGTQVAIFGGRGDAHGRMYAINENGEVIVITKGGGEDGKDFSQSSIVDNSLVEAWDAYDAGARGKTNTGDKDGIVYTKDSKGNVHYFDKDGKPITGEDLDALIKKKQNM